MNIDIGFMFLNDFEKRREIAPISHTLIIDFRPGRLTERLHNCYELYGMTDESARYDLPYQEQCTSKWYKKFDENLLGLETNKRLRELLRLYNWTPEDQTKTPEDKANWKPDDETEWKPLSLKNSKYICKFGSQDGQGEFFNNATLMMYEAFANPEIVKKYPGKEEFIINRINKTVITRDMIRLQRAMSSFDDPDHPESLEVKAVDATSVKNSLQLHESRPTYRDWLRRSLNRVLNTRHKKLSRIYILKDGDDGIAEFQTFLRIMQYYLDYFHYEIPEMTRIVHLPNLKSTSGDPFITQEWFIDQWNSFSQRVSVRVTTTGILSKFADRVLSEPGYPEIFNQIFQEPFPTIDQNLANLDYLTTDHMIYNFLNPRADTEELQFPAYLYRDELNIEKERSTLFYLKTDDADFKQSQTQHRVNLLANSIVEYKDKYGSAVDASCIEENFRKSMPREKETADTKISKIIDKRSKDSGNYGDYGTTLDDQRTLVAIRAAFESALFGHFKRHFDYLYKVLEFQSKEIRFWDNVTLRSVEEIDPFNKGGNTVAGLTEKIREEIEGKLAAGVALPVLAPAGKPAREEVGSTVAKSLPRVFLSYASEDRSKVKRIYDEITKTTTFDPWMDKENLLPGQNWPLEIERAVKGATFFVACLSRNSVSKRGYVQRESRQALDKWKEMLIDDIYLIPVRLDNSEIPEEFATQFQSVDLFVDGEWNEEGWKHFLAALNKGLEERQP
jgi:hypothetical protein